MRIHSHGARNTSAAVVSGNASIACTDAPWCILIYRSMYQLVGSEDTPWCVPTGSGYAVPLKKTLFLVKSY